MSQQQYDRRGRRHRDSRRSDGGGSLDTSGIVLKPKEGPLPPDLFDTVARKTAKEVGHDRNLNKPSQLRPFYDEVVMWDEKVRRDEERFREYLPFIRMLNAKAAYAKGRRHVDQNFVDLIHHCLAQVDEPEALRNFKLFFEAFMGFYKIEGPSG